MEAQITSTMDNEQDAFEIDQSSPSPACVISDVFSLNAVEQTTVHDEVLDSLTVGPGVQSPLHAEGNLPQDCDTGSDTEDEFFDCIVCGEGFSEMNNLLKHSLTHNGESKEYVVLKESSKENNEALNNTFPYPNTDVGENVDCGIVDLTDDGNAGVHERILFRDLGNNAQPMIVSTQGTLGDPSENMASNLPRSTDTFRTNPEEKSM